MEADFKILIALDSSNHSKKTVEYGLFLGQQLKAKIGLLYIIDKDKELGNIDAGILPDDMHNELKSVAIQQVCEIINAHQDLEIKQFIVDGDPVEILKTTEKWNANLLVIGNHIRKGLFSHLKKSVAEHIIEHSTIPVTVVSDKMKW